MSSLRQGLRLRTGETIPCKASCIAKVVQLVPRHLGATQCEEPAREGLDLYVIHHGGLSIRILLTLVVILDGGGNFAGSISDPTYNGCNLATDSIVVSINYRLGPLGFLGLSKFGIGGNMGTQDQLLGLQWVQTNIQAFGGDPVSLPSPRPDTGANVM